MVASLVAIVGLAAAGAPAQAATSAPSSVLTHSVASAAAVSLPCDIYSADGTPCVAAYSMGRALYSSYDGPLYQVQRASDGTTANIGLLSTGGYVDAAEQDSFCAGTTCTITEIYDQSPEGNDLTVEGAGGNGSADSPAVANALPITIDGHEAYGLNITPGTGYRDDSTKGIAVDGEPEGMYMVASGTNVNSGCCFDFGNAETNNDDNGAGHMDAVNLTTYCESGPCTGVGPWVEADMENGQYMGGDGSNPDDTGNGSDFVTAMLGNNGQTTFELAGGNAQSGGLTTYWDGSLPSGYSPMHQEGAIVLGTGGDNSHSDVGSFFEGVMTSGFPSAAASAAVQASIVSAGYAGSSDPAAFSAAGPAMVHSGYSSVYTVDSATRDLQETYLPAMGDPWSTQNLSTEYGTPPVMAGTEPVALTHDGYTSVYTVDASNGDLQETYLTAIGQPWATQNLSTEFGTPPTDVTPTAVYHSGYTSVYTVDASSGDLQETYLPAIGDPWSTQNLSANYGTPPVLAGISPVAAFHFGYTSVYTVDASNDHLQETYLPAMGDPWSTQDLSVNYGTPATTETPTAVVHDGYTSVYTVDASDNQLQETYLPEIGDSWTTQDLSAKYGTPAVASGTQPVALFHTGYTSVYTVDASNDHLQETYLPAMGDSWSTQDLSANYGTPATTESPIVLLHPDTSGALTWTSVYTIDTSNGDLQETYLPEIGDSWTTQDLSANYGTPPA
jgi:Alpha-L-arabinofuranosidase B, catalytic